MAVLFISAPYRGDVGRNIARAAKVAMLLWRMGHVPVTPHLLTIGASGAVPEETIMAGLLQVQMRCQGTVFCEGWETSEGCEAEHRHALALPGHALFYWPEVPPP